MKCETCENDFGIENAYCPRCGDFVTSKTTATDFHDLALAFVRQHNCAMHTPVELIESAMRAGAELAGNETAIAKIRQVKNDLKKRRERNFIG